MPKTIPHKYIDGVETKHCPRCEEFIPLSGFACNRSSPDGLNYYCKKCSASVQKEMQNKKRLSRPKVYKVIQHRFIDGVEVKRCTGCKEWLELSMFTHNKNSIDSLHAYCRNCQKNNTRKSNDKHCLTRRYGVTKEEYERMLESQGGVCAICGKPPGKKRLAVDHDHKTGKVRGLLCGNCNFGLGYFQDNQGLLAKAVEYLNKKEEA